MFREMRRKKQELPQEDVIRILQEGTSGVLAVSGDNDYPYAVPLSYVYDSGKIYFHCATSGHKLDGIRKNNKVSFCVISQDQVVPEEYTSYFRSDIAFGQIRILENDLEKRAAIKNLAEKYVPNGSPSQHENAAEKEWTRFCMLEMTVEHMTGKEARELAKDRRS